MNLPIVHVQVPLFKYNPAGGLNIINNTSLRDVFVKGPKYPEPKSINRKNTFKILMEFRRRLCQTIGKTWKGELRNSFRMIEECEVVIQIRIEKPNESMSTRTSMVKDSYIAKHLYNLHDKYVDPADKVPPKYCFCVKITLHRLFDKGTRYCQFTWQPSTYSDDTYERGNPWQSWICCGISTKDEELDLPSLYSIPKLSVLANSVILLGLPNAQRNLFPKY